jgi:glycosyltransferase involved in cell wall biosynthesis
VTDHRPLVSIVTPTRNQAAFIEDTLRSVQAQTYAPIEHVVVDGASTDGTLSILEAWKGEYELSWVSEPDRGMYDAINRGMRESRGEILAYLNSDDLLLPWAVTAAVEAFERFPNASIVFGDALRVDDASGEVGIDLHAPFSPRWTARFGTIVQPAVFWRRSTYERFGEFDADLRYIADLDYWLRVGGEAEVVRIDEVLAVVRWHEQSLTVSRHAKMRAEERTMRARHHGDPAVVGGITKFIARVIHGWQQRVRMMAIAVALRGRSSSGWPRFREAMRPRLQPGLFVLALLPLVGRVVPLPWLRVEWPKDFRIDLAGERDSGRGD